MSETSINLHSMPLNFDAWAKIVAGLTAAQEGTLLRAVRAAWQAGHRGAPAATLPNHDAELGRMLGDRSHLDIVRRLFQPVEGAPELLAWPWLAAEYAAALERYQRRKLAGVESGETRRQRAKGRQARPGASAPPAPEQGGSREQCSNNVHVMFEQPEPYPVGDGSSNHPPTGGAVPAPAPEGRAAPPNYGELAQAWVQYHPALLADLERQADAYMADLNPRWIQTREGPNIRARWLRGEITRAYAAKAGVGEVAALLMARAGACDVGSPEPPMPDERAVGDHQ